MHDAYRVDKGGNPTFDKVMKAAKLMQKHRVEFNILTTVNSANEDHPLEVYHFLRDEVGTHYIQFIPIVERINSDGRTGFQEGSQVTHRTVNSEKWGRFLIDIFDEWVRRDVGSVFVQMFDAALASWVGAPPAMCIFSETCGNALALEHNGDWYLVRIILSSQSILLGNIKKEKMIDLVASDTQRKFGTDKRDVLPQDRRKCEVRFACNGECPKNRFISTPDGEPGRELICVPDTSRFLITLTSPCPLWPNFSEEIEPRRR